MRRVALTTSATRAVTIVLIGALAAVGLFALRQAVRKGLFSSVGAVLIAGGTLAALSNAFLGVTVLLVVSTFDGIIKGMSTSLLVLIVKDYFLGLCLATWLVRRALREPSDAFSQRLTIPVLLFGAYALAQLAHPNSPSILTSLAGVRSWILWLPLFVIAYDTIDTRWRFDWLLKIIIALALIMGAYGILQYMFGFEHLFALSDQFRAFARRYVWTSPEGIASPRVFSTTVSAGTFGSTMAICGLVAVGTFFYWRGRAARLVAAGTAAICFTGMVLSGTRSAVVAAAFGGLVMILISRRTRLALAAAVVALIVSQLALSMSEGLLGERMATLWENKSYTIERPTYPLRKGLAEALRHPLGVGPATGVGVADRLQGAVERNRLGMIENEFGRAFAELGIPGGILFTYMVWMMVAESLRARRKLHLGRLKLLSAGLFGATAAQLLLLMVGSALYGAPAAPFLWCIIAGQLRLPQFESEIGAVHGLPEPGLEKQPIATA